MFSLRSVDDDKSEIDIIKESQLCAEHRFNNGKCLETSNCVYMEWFITEFNNSLSFCFSYSELMKYFIGVPEQYLIEKGIKNHNVIDKTNFCDIIDDNHKFLGFDGNILLCQISPY
jgi:hypothetical protein